MSAPSKRKDKGLQGNPQAPTQMGKHITEKCSQYKSLEDFRNRSRLNLVLAKTPFHPKQRLQLNLPLQSVFSHENYLPCRWPPLQVACPPLTGVIYLSSLSKQPISVSCHHPNGGFYLNKEKWPKSQGRHSNTGYCQISAHTHLKWDLWDLPQIFRFGVKFLEILFLWGATSLDSSGPLNDFLNWRKFSWLPHNGLDRVVTHPTTEYNTTFEDWTEANNVLNFHFCNHVIHLLCNCHHATCTILRNMQTDASNTLIPPPPGTPLTPLDLSWVPQEL